MNKKLIQEIQEGKAVVRFTLADELADLKLILKRAFPLDNSTPRGEFEFYGTLNQHSKAWDPMELEDTKCRRILSVGEIMDNTEVYWKDANGVLINLDDMDEKRLRNILKEIVRTNERRGRPITLEMFDIKY